MAKTIVYMYFKKGINQHFHLEFTFSLKKKKEKKKLRWPLSNSLLIDVHHLHPQSPTIVDDIIGQA